ncbi:hypothetical protein [Sphingobacterium sp. BS-2]|uniref:hypothetical protein n=1 Tax=Sphingobacterium sp. BS-2 TaxID=3377129 RepID=UPI0038FD207B
MSKNLILLFLTFGLLTTYSCNKDQEIENKDQNLSSKELSDIDSYTKQIFVQLEEVSQRGDFEAYYRSKENEISKALNTENLSSSFSNYLLAIQNSSSFSNSSDYLNHVRNIVKEAKSNSSITNDELKSILIISKTMEDFVKYGESFENSGKYTEFKASARLTAAANAKQGWWDSWGKCAAGIIGGAGLGGLAGAAVTTPTVVGIPIGTAVGVISGGLAGAAASC